MTADWRLEQLVANILVSDTGDQTQEAHEKSDLNIVIFVAFFINCSQCFEQATTMSEK